MNLKSTMKNKTTTYITIIISILTISWGILIYVLSAQNGAETANTSAGITDIIVKILYQDATLEEWSAVDTMIRTMAHFVLFFVLGGLAALSAKLLKIFWGIPYILVGIYSFQDEWFKQFVDGRHFHFWEALLNVGAGIAGVLCMYTIITLYKRMKKNN